MLGQSSYTPFLTENIYQALRSFIPEDPAAGDTRSIHFLSFPEVKEEYFDADIERQMKRMQTVIELTRNIREKNSLSLKVNLHDDCDVESIQLIHFFRHH
jgi:isoleucyl-tRNA synthetase